VRARFGRGPQSAAALIELSSQGSVALANRLLVDHAP